MTIDERVRALSGSRMSTTSETFEQRLRLAFYEVAREQRHACAVALIGIDSNAWSKDAAREAVMRADSLFDHLFEESDVPTQP